MQESRGPGLEDSQDWAAWLLDFPPPPVVRPDLPSTTSESVLTPNELELTLASRDLLLERSSARGVSPRTWFLAATAAWLGRVGRCERVLLATVPSKDVDAAYETVAPCDDAWLIPVDLRGDPLFHEILTSVDRSLRNAVAHGLSLQTVVRGLGPTARAVEQLPISAVVQWGGDGGHSADSPTASALARCEVATGLRLSERGVVLTLRSHGGLYRATTAARMLEQLKTVVEGTLIDPERRVSRLPLMTEVERGLVLRDWQGPPLDLPRPATFHGLFEERAAESPDAVAVVYEDQELTYAELDAQGTRLARHLRALGVGLETRVGVYMSNSLELVVAVLGVFKAGGVYVPLSPQHPRKYLRYILSDTHVSVVLSHRAHTQDLEEEDVRVVQLPLSGEARTLAEASDVPIEDVPATGESLCAVMYTSGSTGTPKGVELSHQSLLSRVFWMQSVGELNAQDRHILIAPMHIARFVGQLFWPLLTGARIYVTRPEGDKDNAYLLSLIHERRITAIHLGPTIARILLLRREELAECTCLRNVFCSGEAFPVDLQHEFRKYIPFATLHKCYGLAETNFVTYCRYGDPRETATIGRPNYMRVYILDENLEPVPIGVAGEICSAGIGLARGFANKSDLTAQRFVPDPFGGEPGGRLYRTGDLGRWLPDGNVEFLGRIDHQVKVRGYPVDLGEIESVLSRHPALGAAVVVTRETRSGDTRLVGYVVPRSADRVPDIGELRKFLADRLPSYMVPSSLMTLDEIPMRSGKIDRRGLPEPDSGRHLPEETYAPPGDDLERTLVGLWEELLDVERVGIDDGFFDLGGHSLLAIRLVSRVGRELGVEVSFGDLFQHATIRDLAEVVRDKEAVEVPEIGLVEPSGDYPITPMQETFYALDLMGRGPSFNCKTCVAVDGPLDVDALNEAWRDVFRRHESLRATFCFVGGEPRQTYHTDVPFSLQEIDFSGENAEGEKVRAWIAEEVSRPFEMEGPCLVRSTLVRLGTDRHLILVVAPHIGSDGWSLQVVLRDLFRFYRARDSAQTDPLPPLAFQYKDFAGWYLDRLDGDEFARHRDYWYEKLGSTPPLLELKTDFPRPPLKTNKGRSEFVEIEQSTAEGVRRLSQRLGVTPFMTLVAAVKIMLRAYSGQRDVVVGTPMAGRGLEVLEDQVGNYISVVALRDRMDDREPFRAFLDRVKQTIVEAHEHQAYPINNLITELDVPVDMGRNTIFDVLVAYHDYGSVFDGSGCSEELEIRSVLVCGQRSRFDLAFDFSAHNDKTTLEIEYPVELFRPGRIAGMGEALVRLLKDVAADPDMPIEKLVQPLEEE